MSNGTIGIWLLNQISQKTKNQILTHKYTHFSIHRSLIFFQNDFILKPTGSIQKSCKWRHKCLSSYLACKDTDVGCCTSTKFHLLRSTDIKALHFKKGRSGFKTTLGLCFQGVNGHECCSFFFLQNVFLNRMT